MFDNKQAIDYSKRLNSLRSDSENGAYGGAKNDSMDEQNDEDKKAAATEIKKPRKEIHNLLKTKTFQSTQHKVYPKSNSVLEKHGSSRMPLL